MFRALFLFETKGQLDTDVAVLKLSEPFLQRRSCPKLFVHLSHAVHRGDLKASFAKAESELADSH